MPDEGGGGSGLPDEGGGGSGLPDEGGGGSGLPDEGGGGSGLPDEGRGGSVSFSLRRSSTSSSLTSTPCAPGKVVGGCPNTSSYGAVFIVPWIVLLSWSAGMLI